MKLQEAKNILHNGLWKQNTAVSLGLATTVVMALSGASISPIRNFVPNEIRIPVYILIIAMLVTVVQYLMNAYMYSLYIVLGIFIPLIVTNCIVLARIEAFAGKNPVLPAALDGFAMGMGLTAVLAVLGGMREIFGHGTLFSGLDLALGEMAKGWVITIIPDYHGFLFAILPPGAFIGLGLLIAGKNYLTLRAEKKLKVIKISVNSARTV
jgi:electron transport complex protein RnfE